LSYEFGTLNRTFTWNWNTHYWKRKLRTTTPIRK